MHSNVHLSRSKAPFAMLVALFLAFALAAPAQASDSDSDSNSEPQSISKADSNDGGANGQCDTESDTETESDTDTNAEGESGAESDGPYCSTRDGSASENGNGDGEATGKPCAGCVGKADNKNPQGQIPDGSDQNNGYECDGNNGIGKGNPAHTACTDDETTSSDEPGDSDETGKPEEPGNPDQPGDTAEPDAVDGPDSPSTVPGTEIAGVELEAQPNTNQTTTVAAKQPARTASTVLPQTGTPDSLEMLLFAGLGMTGIGAMTLLYRRRTATSS